jgi:hypothetical protein
MRFYLVEGRYYKTIEEARNRITGTYGGGWAMVREADEPNGVPETWHRPRIISDGICYIQESTVEIFPVDIVERDGRCSTCGWWRNMSRCDLCGGTGSEEDMPLGESFFIYATVSDDSGLYEEFRTGPDFGCVRWEGRTEQ